MKKTAYLLVVCSHKEQKFFEGKFLRGPHTPEYVRRNGYGFTASAAEAWPFESLARAEQKGRIVDRHMGWGDGRLQAVVPEEGSESERSNGTELSDDSRPE